MRQYRGKPVDGKEWVHGWHCEILEKLNLKHYIILDGSQLIDRSPSGARITGLVEVIPESVGQGTGAKDVNGNEIYDGDILDPHPDPTKKAYRKYLRMVEWDDYLMRWQAKFSDESGEFITTKICEQCEIAGNTTDDPGLLKGQDHA